MYAICKSFLHQHGEMSRAGIDCGVLTSISIISALVDSSDRSEMTSVWLVQVLRDRVQEIEDHKLEYTDDMANRSLP